MLGRDMILEWISHDPSLLIDAAPHIHAEIARLRAHAANMDEWKTEIGRYAEETARLRREKEALLDALASLVEQVHERVLELAAGNR